MSLCWPLLAEALIYGQKSKDLGGSLSGTAYPLAKTIAAASLLALMASTATGFWPGLQYQRWISWCKVSLKYNQTVKEKMFISPQIRFQIAPPSMWWGCDGLSHVVQQSKQRWDLSTLFKERAAGKLTQRLDLSGLMIITNAEKQVSSLEELTFKEDRVRKTRG